VYTYCVKTHSLSWLPSVAIHKSLTGDSHTNKRRVFKENSSPLVITVRTSNLLLLIFNNITVAAQLIIPT